MGMYLHKKSPIATSWLTPLTLEYLSNSHPLGSQASKAQGGLLGLWLAKRYTTETSLTATTKWSNAYHIVTGDLLSL